MRTISFADEFLGRFYTALAAGMSGLSVLLSGINGEEVWAQNSAFASDSGPDGVA